MRSHSSWLMETDILSSTLLIRRMRSLANRCLAICLRAGVLVNQVPGLSVPLGVLWGSRVRQWKHILIYVSNSFEQWHTVRRPESMDDQSPVCRWTNFPQDSRGLTSVTGGVPVPGTSLMFGLGVALFFGWHHRSRHQLGRGGLRSVRMHSG